MATIFQQLQAQEIAQLKVRISTLRAQYQQRGLDLKQARTPFERYIAFLCDTVESTLQQIDSLARGFEDYQVKQANMMGGLSFLEKLLPCFARLQQNKVQLADTATESSMLLFVTEIAVLSNTFSRLCTLVRRIDTEVKLPTWNDLVDGKLPHNMPFRLADGFAEVSALFSANEISSSAVRELEGKFKQLCNIQKELIDEMRRRNSPVLLSENSQPAGTVRVRPVVRRGSACSINK